MFQVFHRTWWKENPEWPNGLEPQCGKRIPIGEVETEQEARILVREWNEEHDFGRYKDQAEYEKD